MNLELVGSVFLTSVLSGVVPLVNAEIIVAAAAAASPTDVYAIVIATSVGQMIAKVGLYALARWLPERLPARAKKHLDKATEKVERVRAGGWGLVFVSSLTGFPPFYVVSLAAGVVQMKLLAMLLPGLAGRLIRFWILAEAAAAAGGAVSG